MNGAATQIASRQFDDDFFQLPSQVREQVQRKVDAMGARLDIFPHFRMVGSERYRLRVGDYALFIVSIGSKGRFTWWQLAIAGKFIAAEPEKPENSRLVIFGDVNKYCLA